GGADLVAGTDVVVGVGDAAHRGAGARPRDAGRYDPHAFLGVARDDVALGVVGHAVAVGADPVPLALYQDAKAVAQGGAAVHVGADEVAGDHVIVARDRHAFAAIARTHVPAGLQ